MKTKSFEEVRKALLVAKESIAENIEELNRLEKAEEETVTLQIEPEREREITIPPSKLYLLQMGTLSLYRPEETWVVAMRSGGSLSKKAFILNDDYDWELGKDEAGVLCLVPLKKES